jgi:PHD/YefM family antitoxin component YafN of YafNO toxin-antitoxin module
MLDLHPQYIKNAKGKKTHVVLSAAEFEQIIELLEDLEDIEAIKKVKEEENEEDFIPFREYVEMRESKFAEV